MSMALIAPCCVTGFQVCRWLNMSVVSKSRTYVSIYDRFHMSFAFIRVRHYMATDLHCKKNYFKIMMGVYRWIKHKHVRLSLIYQIVLLQHSIHFMNKYKNVSFAILCYFLGVQKSLYIASLYKLNARSAMFRLC